MDEPSFQAFTFEIILGLATIVILGVMFVVGRTWTNIDVIRRNDAKAADASMKLVRDDVIGLRKVRHEDRTLITESRGMIQVIEFRVEDLETQVQSLQKEQDKEKAKSRVIRP